MMTLAVMTRSNGIHIAESEIKIRLSTWQLNATDDSCI